MLKLYQIYVQENRIFSKSVFLNPETKSAKIFLKKNAFGAITNYFNLSFVYKAVISKIVWDRQRDSHSYSEKHKLQESPIQTWPVAIW